MANPSYAGAEQNDPTVLRGCHFARLWGFDGWTGVNAEPYIATDPMDLQKWRDDLRRNDLWRYKQIRDANLKLIFEISAYAGIRVAAWGNLVPDTHHVLSFFSHHGKHPIYCLGTTKSGAPKHPMARGRHRIPNDQQPLLWQDAGGRLQKTG